MGRLIFIENTQGPVDYKGEDPSLFVNAEVHPTGISCVYKGESGEEVWPTYTPPEPPAPDYGTKITRLAFLNRLTDSEAVAIDLASIGETQEAATVRRVMSKVNAAKFIDLTDPDTVNGINYLISAGLLTAERGNEILTAPVQEKELP